MNAWHRLSFEGLTHGPFKRRVVITSFVAVQWHAFDEHPLFMQAPQTRLGVDQQNATGVVLDGGDGMGSWKLIEAAPICSIS